MSLPDRSHFVGHDMVQRIGHGAMNQCAGRTGETARVIPAQLVGTAALRDFNPFYDRLGSKPGKLGTSK